MLALLATVVLAQTVQPTVITNGSNFTRVGVTGGALDVNCVTGCSAGSSGDGGPTTVTQGNARDGGTDWAVQAKLWDGIDTADVTAASALKVDGSGVTQPVSLTSTTVTGNVTVVQGTGTNLHVVVDSAPSTAVTGPLTDAQLRAVAVPISGTVTANAGSGTQAVSLATMPALVAGSANIGDVDVLTLPALPTGTNNIGDVDVLTLPNVTVGTFPDNEPFNVAQINGVTPLMGNGTTGTGSQRVTIASDNTAFTVNVGTFPDNEPVNVAQMNGVAVSMGAGTTGTGVQRVVLPTDQTAIPVTLTSTTVTGSVAVTGPVTDAQLRASPVPVSLTSTTITGTAAVTQSGTWTVQPGNTANSTPWLTTDTPRTVSSANNSGTCVSVTASTTILASNASRRAYGFKASEDNTAKVHCKLGATATTSNTIFGAGAGWSQDTGAVYTGVIDCIAASGTQSVCSYELN